MPSLLRKIGNTSVPSVGLGLMSLSAAYGQVGTDDERLKFLDSAYRSGCTHWDTANTYGDSEDLLGKWFKKTGKRNEIFLATKFGISVTKEKAFKMNGSPEYVREQCNKSLERLGVDYIDLYYIQRVDSTVPIELTIRAMAELVREGKIRHIGISECTESVLRRAQAVHQISAIQVEYSAFTLDLESPEVGLLKTAREFGIKVVAYSPLGRGFLTGKYRSHHDLEESDHRRKLTKYSEENFPKILELVNRLENIGKTHNATSSQIALAWILAQGEDFFVIPGTKTEKCLFDNIAAADIQLSEDEIALVRKLAEEGDAIPGDRFPPGWRVHAYPSNPPLEGYQV